MAKKKTTRARLVARAASAKRAPKVAAPAKQRPRSAVVAKTARAPEQGPGALEIPGLQVGDVQETVRSVVTYVQQNPLAAAAVAIGVGVMLTSMYWDNRGEHPGKRPATR